MNWRKTLIGPYEGEEDYPGSRFGLPRYRRWYCYGWRSLDIFNRSFA